MPDKKTVSNIQEFSRRVIDDGEEIELVISADVEKSEVKHIEIAVLASVQCEGFPRIEEYESIVLRCMRDAISLELREIQRIEDQHVL